MYVLGTAGHVDHGKSALVKAITGIDPDRLAEEKERGLTIELGFAWLKLPSGREVSIVDVPGHERFIKNMLAGVGGIDIALLIIAADEGVMPQTKEHLSILDLLNINSGLVVITKKDLVDDEMLELVTLDIEEALTGTSLEDSRIITTSAVTGDGLPELLSAIDNLLESTTPRRDINRPRLSVDRIFTMKGFGTVVTGTLLDGKFTIGQQVEILPTGKQATIRGLQSHKKRVDRALPGTRVAVNLSGLAVDDLKRGMLVTTPGWLNTTRFIDAKIKTVSDLPQPINHNKSITFHSGAAEVTGKIRLLDKEKLNREETGWAQLILSESVAVAQGDRFIIRSSTGTLGGGVIVDTDAKRHRRFQQSVIEKLESREKGSPEDLLLAIIESKEPVDFKTLMASGNISQEEATHSLKALLSEGRAVRLGTDDQTSVILSVNGWNQLIEKTQEAARAYHKQFPLRSAMPKEELRSRLKILPQNFNNVLQKLISENVLTESGALVKLAEHEVHLSKSQQSEIDVFLTSLSANPFSPPNDSLPEPELLNFLIDKKLVVKMGENIVFSAGAYSQIENQVIEHLKSTGKITVAEVRDMFKTSRKYALAIMEYMDEQKLTRRVGDERVLR